MDGRAAIEHNHEALKRILATLFAMAGLAGGDSSACAAGRAATLPRRLRLAVLRLLRPAEAATRRLIIALAATMRLSEGMTFRLTAKRKSSFVRDGAGTGIVLRRAVRIPDERPAPPATPLGFPLFDPLRMPRLGRRAVANAVPRICVPGVTGRFPLTARQPLSPDDPMDVGRLHRRLAALGRALDDLPGLARRFARWRARSVALRDQPGPRRIWPLRPGRPRGCRVPRYDPSARRRAGVREVDEVLAHAHALAMFALQRRDTS